jgi:hypothetical protein
VNDEVFVISGWVDSGISPAGPHFSPNVMKYTLATDSWTTGLAPIPTPVEFACSVVFGTKIIVIGGMIDATPTFTNAIQVYDTVADSWTTPAITLPLAYGYMDAAVIGTDLYVTSGATGGYPPYANQINETFKIDIGQIIGPIGQPPVITDVERGSLKITFTGGGQTYTIESSTDPYDYVETNMTWVTEVTGLAPGTWEDTGAPTSGEKYYRIVGETSADVSDTVGLMWVDVFNGRNMVSSPFEPYPVGGGTPGLSTLDKIVGEQLTGHGAVRSLSDTIEAWDGVNQKYVRAWLQIGSGWKDWDVTTNPPQFGLDADVGYWFNRVLGHVDTTVMFCGRVSTEDEGMLYAGRVIPIGIKRNLVGSCFPVGRTLDASGLEASGFIGHGAVRSLSDTVEFWDNATASYERFWLKTGVGFQPWDIGDPMRDLAPGDSIWVNLPLRTVGFTWFYPNP